LADLPVSPSPETYPLTAQSYQFVTLRSQQPRDPPDIPGKSPLPPGIRPPGWEPPRSRGLRGGPGFHDPGR